jgi:hypothetical protein
MAGRDGRIQIALGLFVPCGLRALRSLQIAGAISRTISMALMQSLNAIHKKAQLVLGFFVYGAQEWSRTTDTRIFSPLLYRLSYLGILSCCACESFVKAQDLSRSLTNVSSLVRFGLCLVFTALATLKISELI